MPRDSELRKAARYALAALEDIRDGWPTPELAEPLHLTIARLASIIDD